MSGSQLRSDQRPHRQGRTHIHFSESDDKLRHRNQKPITLWINVEAAHKDGVRFYKGAPSTVLARGPIRSVHIHYARMRPGEQFFRMASQWRPGQQYRGTRGGSRGGGSGGTGSRRP